MDRNNAFPFPSLLDANLKLLTNGLEWRSKSLLFPICALLLCNWHKRSVLKYLPVWTVCSQISDLKVWRLHQFRIGTYTPSSVSHWLFSWLNWFGWFPNHWLLLLLLFIHLLVSITWRLHYHHHHHHHHPSLMSTRTFRHLTASSLRSGGQRKFLQRARNPERLSMSWIRSLTSFRCLMFRTSSSSTIVNITK